VATPSNEPALKVLLPKQADEDDSVPPEDEDQSEKKPAAKEATDGVDTMMKYLSTVSSEHEDEIARKHVIKVFSQFKDDMIEGIGQLSQKQAQLAQEQLFEDWKVDLTSDQEQRFEQEHFIPTWREYAGKTDFSTLSVANAVPFMRSLMSLTMNERVKIEMF
jgi:hypothetical protein